MANLEVGTSGWTYRDWRGRFYPKELQQRDWLAYYARRFSTVELNVTTYRLPKERDLVRWQESVPPNFTYSIKLSRLITHRKRPGEPRTFVETYMRAIAPLTARIANVLAQFPPTFARDDAALHNFLDALPAVHRYVVEFRHASWYDETVFALLRERGISLCLHDLLESTTPIVLTGPALYIRLHGPVRAYAGSYRRARLEQWAATIRELSPQVDAAYVYFNNDERAFAVKNALQLRAFLEIDPANFARRRPTIEHAGAL